MCIAIPGKIISVDGQHAQVDFSGNVVNVNVGIITPEVEALRDAHGLPGMKVLLSAWFMERVICWATAMLRPNSTSRSTEKALSLLMRVFLSADGRRWWGWWRLSHPGTFTGHAITA